ncbi:hypothetical protein ABPG75_010942 [Micractinium tetrahymenae]
MAAGGRARLGAQPAAAAPARLPPALPAPVAVPFCSTSGSARRRLRQHAGAAHAALCTTSSSGAGAEQPGAARLHSLRFGPAPAQPARGPRLPPRRLHALSPAWPEQPGDRRQQQQQHEQHQRQQQRGMATQPPWWQFWGRSSGCGGDGGEEAAAGATGAATPGGLVPPAPLPVGTPSAAQERELRAVNVAVFVNGVIFVAKMATWAVTGSGALLAEAMHSVADVANQMLLKHGVIRSRRKPTREHQYGFHKEKYVYALISAACVFCVGCGASVLHGISSLWTPHPLENMALSLAVLGCSGLLEAYSLQVAFKSIKQGAEQHGMSVWQFVQRGRDPTTTAILWEDGGAVAGLGLAGFFTALTWWTGQPQWDALGSIAVGVLMGGIALQLMRTNKRFLIGKPAGQAMEPTVEAEIVQHLQNDSMVVKVIDPKSEEMGDGVYRFKAEIQWSGEHVVQKYLAGQGRDSLYRQIRKAACEVPAGAVPQATLEDAIDLAMMEFGKGVIRTVGSEIDRLEGELREKVPGLVYVDLETDKGAEKRRDSLLGSADWPSDIDIAAMRRQYEGAARAAAANGSKSSAGGGAPPAAAA